MSLLSEFSNFKSTNDQDFNKNNPEDRQFTDRDSFQAKGVPVFSPKPNEKSIVRLIPWPGFGYFARQVRIHFQVGTAKHSIACPIMKDAEAQCPLCQAARKAYDQGNKTLGGLWGAKTRHMVWLIDRQNPAKGPQLMLLPDKTINEIRSRMKDPMSGEVMSLDDLDEGRDIIFTKKKETPSSPYLTINDIFIHNEKTPLGTLEQAEPWLKFVTENTFDSLMNWKTPEEIRKLADMPDVVDIAQKAAELAAAQAAQAQVIPIQPAAPTTNPAPPLVGTTSQVLVQQQPVPLPTSTSEPLPTVQPATEAQTPAPDLPKSQDQVDMDELMKKLEGDLG